jgi:hypothetical protein
MGREDVFPPTTLSNRSRLGKPTFAGTRGNEDAPNPAGHHEGGQKGKDRDVCA